MLFRKRSRGRGVLGRSNPALAPRIAHPLDLPRPIILVDGQSRPARLGRFVRDPRQMRARVLACTHACL